MITREEFIKHVDECYEYALIELDHLAMMNSYALSYEESLNLKRRHNNARDILCYLNAILQKMENDNNGK